MKITFLHRVVFSFALLSTFALAVENTAPMAPKERRVSIIMAATDGSGNPLQGLAKEHLSVTDNGVAGTVLDLRKGDALPLRLGFILFASSNNFAQQQAAAIEIARKVLRPGVDRAFVIPSRGDRLWTPSKLDWQNDSAGLETAVRALEKNVGLPDPFLFEISHYEGTLNRSVTILRYQGGEGTSVFNILWTMMKSDPTPARHAVVAFRDPWAHSPGTGSASPEYTQVIEANHLHLITDAQQAWTPFFIVGLEQPNASAPGALTRSYNPTLTGQGGAMREYHERYDRFIEMAYNAGRVNVQRVADETGGRVWWSTKKNYTDAVSGIVNLLNSQYVLTYSVPVTETAPIEHTLQVNASSPNTRISVQKMYYSRVAPKQSQASPAAAPQSTAK